MQNKKREIWIETMAYVPEKESTELVLPLSFESCMHAITQLLCSQSPLRHFLACQVC